MTTPNNIAAHEAYKDLEANIQRLAVANQRLIRNVALVGYAPIGDVMAALGAIDEILQHLTGIKPKLNSDVGANANE
jgi:hypothetical protein